jgi:hypothetical protein
MDEKEDSGWVKGEFEKSKGEKRREKRDKMKQKSIFQNWTSNERQEALTALRKAEEEQEARDLELALQLSADPTSSNNLQTDMNVEELDEDAELQRILELSKFDQ